LICNSSTLEDDQPQHYRPAAFVIAQQYSSATFIAFGFHSSKEKLGAHVKNIIISKFLLLLELLKF
jgi:hypothetical protein